MSSLTAANAVIMLSVPLVFPVPQQLQGFAVDDVFSTDPLASAETMMGVDGKLSAGFVFVSVKQNYALQADSESVDLFDDWFMAQQAAHEVFPADAVILLTAVGKKWQMTRGFLTGYPPLPDAKKLLQPRRFAIEWQEMSPAVVA